METKKTQSVTMNTAANNTSKTGVAIDTIDDSDDEGTSERTTTSTTTTTTTTTTTLETASTVQTLETAPTGTYETQATQKATETLGRTDGTQIESLPCEYEIKPTAVETGDGEAKETFTESPLIDIPVTRHHITPKHPDINS